MRTHKKAIALLTAWVALVALVIFNPYGREQHVTQSAPTPKYEITHGGAVLPEIKMPQADTHTHGLSKSAEQGSEVEPSRAPAMTDANGGATKPSPHNREVNDATAERDQGSPPHQVNGQTDRQDKPVPQTKTKNKKKNSHAGHGGGHSGGSHHSGNSGPSPSPDNPTSHPFAPPFSPAFGAFA